MSTKIAADQYENKVVDVSDFGAVGDGVADDTAAIQAAVDSKRGSVVFFPQGTYKITSTILQDTTGLGDVSVCSLIGDGMSQTLIDNQSGAAAFKVTSGVGAEFAYNFAVKDLTIFSTGSLAGTIGIELLGCRFVSFERIAITGMGSHGVYGQSTVGDLTDTAHVDMTQIQIQGCGGYGVYAKTDGDAIQYNWNMYECRVGLNTLGGILGESLTNSEFKNTGVYYNGNFGLRITTGTSGAPAPKVVNIEGCEFDTNEGVQIDLDTGHGHSITLPYLIDNNLSPAFTVGVSIGACQSVVVSQAVPRMNPAVTGKTVVEVDASAVDIVIRDSDYQGWSASNGTFYVDNTTGEVTVDDRLNRTTQFSGSYVAEVRDVSLSKVSATTVTAYYQVSGDQVVVGLRNLDNIDLSPFAGSDILGITLPFGCIAESVGFSGAAVITSDSGAGIPVPTTENSSTLMVFLRAGSGSFLTANDLTTGTSDIRVASLTYIRA